MSNSRTEAVQKLVSAFVVWCMLASGVMGLLAFQVGGGEPPAPAPAFIPSVIDNEIVEIRDGGVYNINSDLTIQNGGVLRVINTTLNFLQDANASYSVQVTSGGAIELQNSTLTTAATPVAMWDPLLEMTLDNATLKMEEHSVLAFPGWLNFTSTLVYINDSWITSVYPDTLFTPFADDFPTFQDVVTDWWTGTDWAPADYEDDAPQMFFRDCGNVTIADSMIEELYENQDLEAPRPFNVSFAPSSAATTPAPPGDVNSLVNLDLDYMVVLSGLNSQVLTIDTFNTMGYSDAEYQVNNVWVHALYNTSANGISGYNGTDYVEWRLDGGVYSNLFMLAHNSPPWSENYSSPLSPTPTLADIADIDIRFNNTYPSGEGTVFFDQIEIIAEIQRTYSTYPTMITLNNTEMSIINSYVGVDWLSVPDDFGSKNALDLQSSSNLYLYNVSISDDEGGLPGKADFLEIPEGEDTAMFVPFRTDAGSEVYYFKWVRVPVADKYGAPVEGAYINATFHFTEQSEVNSVSRINDLSGDTMPEWQYAKQRMVDYLGREYGVGAADFNITNGNGVVQIPLLTTYLNATNYPNGDHVGEYDLRVNYTGAMNYTEYAVCDFTPYPNTQPDDNLVAVDTVVLDGLAQPRPFGSPGLIVNGTMNLAMSGGADEEMTITDFIIVEDEGMLTLSHATLLMSYTDSAPFQIIVRNNGTLVMDNIDLTTLNNRQLKVYLEDNATFTMTDSTTTAAVNMVATGNAMVLFNRTELAGSFDVTDPTASVTLEAWDTQFGRALDDFAGHSTAMLVGCYSPMSPNFLITPSENAEVWIYRWIEVTVYDGMTPANPLENAAIDISTQYTQWSAMLDRSGTTGPDGTFTTTGLSDYIHYDAATGQVVESHYNTYTIDTQYQLNAGTPVHMDSTGLGLATYPDMNVNDAAADRTVILENVLPDLDPPVTVWPVDANASVGRGDMVLINTTITNDGDAAADNIEVWVNDTFQGTSKVIYTEVIDHLEPGEAYDISFQYVWESVDDLGMHNITVTVDPADTIPEQSPGGESNNIGWILVNVTSQPDLAILWYYDIGFSEAYPLVGDDFQITADVWNIGDINATGVVVSFYDDVNGLLGNDTIDVPADPDNPVEASITVNYDTSGTYNIYVVVDEADAISEVDESNNNNSAWLRQLRIWETPDLNIEVLEVLVGSDMVEYGIGGGVPITECNNRTQVTLRAKVWNVGELFASNLYVMFWVDDTLIGQTSVISSLSSGNYEFMMHTWTATTEGSPHNLRAVAYASGGLVSNEATQTLTVLDNRPDLEIVNVSLANNVTQLVDGQDFLLNVTLRNNGLDPSGPFEVDIYLNETQFLATQGMYGDSGQFLNRLGNHTMNNLPAGATTTITVSCDGIATGTQELFVFADPEYNTTDTFTVGGNNYPLVGHLEELDETNNNATLPVTIVMPDLTVRIMSPAFPGNSWKPGEVDSILISGNVVRQDNPNIGVSGIEITVSLADGTTATTTSGDGGFFSVGIPAPQDAGNYTITATGDGVSPGTAWFLIEEPGINLFFWIMIIVIIVVVLIVAITLYLYFVGLGKTVQCGECGAFIPEGAKRCPKCGVEFETEVAKCSVCGAWVPVDVKACPECGTEFTVGTEMLDDYEATMRRQYDDVVRKFREEAKKDLGAEFTEEEFQAWWSKQPTFITFDQWLKEEEEMKRMGSRPCPSCGTENSVTAKICHRCGTVMEPPKPKKPEGKKPEGKAPPPAEQPKPKPAEEKPPAGKPPEQAAAPEEPKAEAKPDKKTCPSCGMEVAATEKTCPICNYEFEKPPEKPPEGGAPPGGPAPVKRVVRKPVKRVVRKPAGGSEGGGQ